MICPCCAGTAREVFRLPVLSGAKIASYAACESCGTLFCPEPDWLDAAYASPAVGDAIDGGAEWRNGVVASLVDLIRPTLPDGPWLDYGSGRGMLGRALRAFGGCDEYDPHRAGSMAPPADGRYALVICLEVIEHCPDPIDLLRRLRACCCEKATILLSTWLRDPVQHGRDWRYLAVEAGQHVTFCSRAGLSAACRYAGLVWHGTFRPSGSEELQIHRLGTLEMPPSPVSDAFSFEPSP